MHCSRLEEVDVHNQRLGDGGTHCGDTRLEAGWLRAIKTMASKSWGHRDELRQEKHRPHDDRYEVANEFADVVTRLWESWHEDAVVLDPVTLMFVDGKRFRPINHEGKHFNVRGPTNAPRSPQGRVPIVQSGGSAAGKIFASKWADPIITEGVNVEKMKACRQEVRANATAKSRNPNA